MPKVTPEKSQRFLTHQRRELIVQLVDEHGSARVRELSDRFGVSTMTIRRDIDALAEANQLARVHGGATKIERGPRSLDEPGFRAKSALQQQEKAAIAHAALRRVQAGSAIGVTAGTTTFQLARRLGAIADLTVVTNSIPIASALAIDERSSAQVVLTGGTPTLSNAIVGPLADRSLSGLHLDLLFMGVHGMGETTGFTTPNLAEAQTNQAFIRSARKVVVLADSTKWGVTGLGTIAPLDAADTLICDTGLSADAIGVLQREITEVELVPT